MEYLACALCVLCVQGSETVLSVHVRFVLFFAVCSNVRAIVLPFLRSLDEDGALVGHLKENSHSGRRQIRIRVIVEKC